MNAIREAWPLLLPVVLAAWLAFAECGALCASPLIVLALLILFMYREPVCRVPPSPLAVVSPVYGRVTLTEPARDPYLNRPAVRIGMDMAALGPFVLRSPIEGRVVQQWYLPEGNEQVAVETGDGGTLTRTHPDQRGRYAVLIRTDERDDVVMVICGTFIMQRLRHAMQAGQRLGQGQRCGRVWFAAAAELYLPAGSRVTAARGDALKAGSAIIATLVHKGPPPAASAPG
jgi:phosphatidylserine decarboxylase